MGPFDIESYMGNSLGLQQDPSRRRRGGFSFPGDFGGERPQTYEECQASIDPNILHFNDPCQGKPRGSSFPTYPSRRPDIYIPEPTEGRFPAPGAGGGSSVDPYIFLGRAIGDIIDMFRNNR